MHRHLIALACLILLPLAALAASESVQVTAAGNFTDPLFIQPWTKHRPGKFMWTVDPGATWDGNMTVQRYAGDSGVTPDENSTWIDVETVADADGDTVKVGDEGSGAWYRAGCKTDGYSAGNATTTIEQWQ